MIRINLLPQAKKQAAAAPSEGSAQGWLIAYLVALVVTSVCLAAVYISFSGTLEEQKQQNSTLSAEIERIRQKSAGLEDVKAKIERSRQLETVVAELQKARLGPTRLMMELSKILSAESGPTIDPQALEECRRENPLCGFNQSWDAKRLWLVSFTEDQRDCRVKGMGKTNEDVAEFLRRLTLSEVFEAVTLDQTAAAKDNATQIDMIGFDLSCRVRY